MNIQEKADQIIKSNVSQKQKIIKLCDLIREIPYKRIGSLDPKDMIKQGQGSCTPKHIFLADYFDKLKIPYKYLIIPFYYKKLLKNLNSEQLAITSEMPIAYHTCLKAKLNGRWRIIDLTWDSTLKNILPVNCEWDGQSDMQLAVIPEQIIETKINPTNFEKQKTSQFSPAEQIARNRFYKMFDKMLAREKKCSDI
jgi:hypothetical protein